MIITQEGWIIQDSCYPNEDWRGDAAFVIDDNSDKGKRFTHFTNTGLPFKLVKNGDSIDIISTESKECSNEVDIDSLKFQLNQLDYYNHKYLEGHISQSDIQPIWDKKQIIREQIRELEQN